MNASSLANRARILTGAALVLTATAIQAQPSISSISGPVGHGGVIVINGNGFGTKVPAAPLVWADFDTGQIGQSLDGVSPEIGPNMSISAVPNRNLQGTFDDSDLRHNRSNGHAYLDANPDQGNWAHRLTFPLSLTNGDKLYYRFWHKQVYNNGWDSNNNQKPVDIYNSGYVDQLYTGFADVGGFRSGGSASSPTQWGGLNINSIQNEWVNYEEEIRLGNGGNGSRRLWVHYDSPARISQQWNDQSMNTWQSGGNYAWITIGEYYRFGPVEYWIDDVYIDDTFARVEIGDAPTFSASSRREIQIPSAWSGNSITVTLNQGALSDFGGAYLYVIDSEGRVNQNGFSLCADCPLPPVLSVQ